MLTLAPEILIVATVGQPCQSGNEFRPGAGRGAGGNGVAQAVADLSSATAFGRTLPGVRPGPVLLAGQSRGGFLALHHAGLKPAEVMGAVNFSGGWYPYGPVTTPYYAGAGRGASSKVPRLWPPVAYPLGDDRLPLELNSMTSKVRRERP
jgi:pimeloyl-ACP methyl ester carboxylesterase